MSNIDKAISKCFDEALSAFPFIDKTKFYSTLEKEYHLKSKDIACNYEVVHQALKDIYGTKHFAVE